MEHRWWTQANRRLYVREMSELTPRVIAGTENTSGFTGGPFFSPDGRSVAFWSGSDPQTFTLKRIDARGGVAITICESPTSFDGSWSADGIVFGTAKGVIRVSPNGGQPKRCCHSAKRPRACSGPQVLPGGKAILFALVTDLTAAQTRQMLHARKRRRLPFTR